jgi:integrase
MSMLRAHVLPRWGSVPVTAVRRGDVVTWVGQLVQDGCKPDVVRRAVATLRMTLTGAMDGGMLTVNPAAAIPLPRPPRHNVRPLTVAQVEALAAAIEHPALRVGGNGASVGRRERPDLALAVRLAAYTGLRAGELWALRRRDLDSACRTLRVRESLAEVGGHLVFGATKTGVIRAVTWPASLDDAISRHMSTRPPDPDALVFASGSGAPTRHRAFSARHFRPALAAAGLPPTTRWHDLRHTHASLLIAMGAHPKAIQERLGHSSITVTLGTYGHLFPGVGDELAQGLDALIVTTRGHGEGTQITTAPSSEPKNAI